MFSKKFNRSIIAFMSLLSAITISAQDDETPQVESPTATEDHLRETIIKRSETINNIKKKDVLIDSLLLQVNDLTDLASILDEQLDSLNNKLNKPYVIDYSVWPLPLLADDVSVFKIGDIKSKPVPSSLKQHYTLVCLVADIDSLLDNTDQSIADITAFAQEKKLNANELIQQSIKGDVAQLLELFKQLKKSNLSSLSTAQIKYIDYLKQRYNNYSVYFE